MIRSSLSFAADRPVQYFGVMFSSGIDITLEDWVMAIGVLHVLEPGTTQVGVDNVTGMNDALEEIGK